MGKFLRSVRAANLANACDLPLEIEIIQPKFEQVPPPTEAVADLCPKLLSESAGALVEVLWSFGLDHGHFTFLSRPTAGRRRYR